MKGLSSLTALLIIALTAGQAAAQTPGKLEPFGLSGKRVTALAAAQHFSPPNSFLYAVTEGDGVFRRSLDPVDSTWSSLGLKGKKLTALDIQIWGAGPALFHTPVVGLSSIFSPRDSMLVYRLEENGWTAADSGLRRNRSVWTMASFASGGHEPPGFAFASTGNLVYRSLTRNQKWNLVYGNIGATDQPWVSAMAVNQNQGIQEVWIGGYEGLSFQPWIRKSSDLGLTWQYLTIGLNLGAENTCHAFAFDPVVPNIVYAGMEGTVIKTIDGGKTWRRTGLRDTLLVHFTALAVDPLTPQHLYAGGKRRPLDHWVLQESFNAGATWKEIPPPALITPVVVSGITSIVADRYAAGVIYIATLGHGVWKYQSVITNVNDRREQKTPKEFALEQNYPNPFSASGISKAPETVIYYSLPASQPVKLEVYNVLGELVATLIDNAKPAGEHGIRWNARNAAGALVPAGIYFYRLHIGAKRVATRKMILLH
jgi:hypothetical protein